MRAGRERAGGGAGGRDRGGRRSRRWGSCRRWSAGEWDPPRPQPLPLQLDPRRRRPRPRRPARPAAPAPRPGGDGGRRSQPTDDRAAWRRQVAWRRAACRRSCRRWRSGEALEVARIASACGRLDGLPGGRPFRAPHHTVSAAGLVGGGTPPRPGEATLAHRGVLFLDELCEFRRDALEALRAPLESGWVSIARVGGQRRLPCRFMLVAAANPCPCGRGEADPDCTCAPLRGAALPGEAERGARRPDRHPRRGAPAERRGDRRRPGRAFGGGAGAGLRGAGAPGAPARPGPLQRGDDAGGGARRAGSARTRRRCCRTSTRASGSAAAPTTGRCGWRRRSPTSTGSRRSAPSRWPRRCRLRRRDRG